MPLFLWFDLIFQFNIYLQAGQTFCPVLWITVLASQYIFKHFKIRSLTVMFQGSSWDAVIGLMGFSSLGLNYRHLSVNETFLTSKINFLQIKPVQRVSGVHSCSNKQRSFCLFHAHLSAGRRNKHPATIKGNLLKYVWHFLVLSLFRKSNLLSNEINVFEMWVSFY